jgi:hypothetical protein
MLGIVDAAETGGPPQLPTSRRLALEARILTAPGESPPNPEVTTSFTIHYAYGVEDALSGRRLVMATMRHPE